MNIKQIIKEEILKEVGDSGSYEWSVDNSNIKDPEYSEVGIDMGRVVYTFKTDGGTPYTVTFNSYGEGEWDREFKANNNYDITNEGNQYKVLATITNITEHFLLNYDVRELEIHHIHTKEESSEILKQFKKGDIGPASPNKRARVNKMFIEKMLPDNYTYHLNGITSMITRK
jgi:hypothetical protein